MRFFVIGCAVALAANVSAVAQPTHQSSLAERAALKADINPAIILSDNPLDGASEGDAVWPFPPTMPGEVSILLMGDTNISLRSDPADAFAPMMATLREADLAYVNLEGPFAGGTDDPNQSDIPHKDWRHSNPDQVAALVAAGIDGVGVANNVTFPPEAMMRSLDVLDGAGVLHTGGGADLALARAPIIFERNGIRIGILQRSALFEVRGHAADADSAGIAPLFVETRYSVVPKLDKPGRPLRVETSLTQASAEQLREDVEALAAQTDIQICTFHWGLSDSVKIVGYERAVAHLCIDAGADMVFGHGSHRLKPIEVYKGKPIYYDAGQGLFDDTRNFDVRKGGTRSQRYPEGLLVRLRATKNGITGSEFAPIWRDTFGDDELRIYETGSDVGLQVIDDLRMRMRIDYIREPFTIQDDFVSIDGLTR